MRASLKIAIGIAAPLVDRFDAISAIRGIGSAIAIELARKGAAAIAITYVGNVSAAKTTLAKIKTIGPRTICTVTTTDEGRAGIMDI